MAGNPGNLPLAGDWDWDGDGVDTIGVYRSSTGQFLLRNSNSAGAADYGFSLGQSGDIAIAGDWNGDGRDTVGVFRPSNGTFYLSNSNDQGFAEIVFAYGLSSDKPIAGDWNNDGIDTIGVFRPSTGYFYLRNTNSAGYADLAFVFGGLPGDLPVAGNWDGQPSTLPPTPTPTSTPVTPPAMNASFSYDGDGKRVKSTINGTTTYFVGAHYEVSGSTITKYYYAGAQRIAMRTNGTLNYLLGDHLGSTSLATNASGQVISELRYKAWGEVRYASGNTQTKYQYTGQFSYEADFGLYFYNARWYDFSLGRFAQADSVLDSPITGWDRYSYARNNPIMYTDPTGHYIDDNSEHKAWAYSTGYKINNWKLRIQRDFGITVMDGKMNWSEKNLETAYTGLNMFNKTLNGNLKTMVEETTFTMTSQAKCKTKSGTRDCYHGITNGTGITFYSSSSNLEIPLINFLHEIGHLLNAVPATDDVFSGSLPAKPTWVKDGYVNNELLLKKYLEPVQAKPMNEPDDPLEYWADAVANYVAGNINLQEPTGAGQDMYDFVSGALAPYINP